LRICSIVYVTGDLRDPASLDRAMKGVKRVFHVAADYRLWAKRKQDIYDSNVGGTKKIFWTPLSAPALEQLIYTSTVATIAVDRPQHPNEFTGAKLEKCGTQALEVDGGKGGARRREKWIAGHCGHADDAGRTVGLEADADRKNHLDFLTARCPLRETGLNLLAWKSARQTPAGRRKGKVGERYLLAVKNLTLKQMLDTLAKITGLRAPILKIPHGLAGCAYASTAFSATWSGGAGHTRRGREDRPAHDVCGCRAPRELGFQAGPVAARSSARCAGTKRTATSPRAAPSAWLAPPPRVCSGRFSDRWSCFVSSPLWRL